MTRTTTDERRLRRWVAGATLGLGVLALGACEVAGSVPIGAPGGDGGDEPPSATVPDPIPDGTLPDPFPDGPLPDPIPADTMPDATVPGDGETDATVPDEPAPSETTVPGTDTSEPSTTVTTAPTELGDGLSLSTQRQMVALVNEQRATGRSCGSAGTFGPAAPLSLDLTLAEAAQRHSEDMAQNNLFSHTGSDGTSGDDRIEAAGYEWRAWGENVAAGNADAAATIAQWFASPTHCANFMKPVFTEVGFGYDQDPSADYVHYWTANLGTPA